MELGAVICTPRKPRCEVCPVAKSCAARQLGLTDQLPNTGKRARVECRHVAVFLVKGSGRILARQRPPGVINAHFWELPQIERCGRHPNLNRLARETLGIKPLTGTPLASLTHNITRYRIRAQVFAGEPLRPMPGARWLTLAELRKKAFTGLDRKILRQLELG